MIDIILGLLFFFILSWIVWYLGNKDYFDFLKYWEKKNNNKD